MTPSSVPEPMSEGEGKPPVVVVSDSTNITSGTEVQEKLISAARVFSNLLKPTYGPRGLDKMLYKTDGSTAVTNDGAKIVAELMVKHPAAKMMVAMGNTQEEACGDGVTTAMMLCGALLEEANNLLAKGLHPLTLVDGYRTSMEVASQQMDADAVGVDDARLIGVAETALTGKGAEAAIDVFSSMVRDALAAVESNVEIAGAENVAMYKMAKGGLRDSHLIRGIAIRRRVQMDNFPNNLKNAKTAVIGGDIKIRKMTRDAEIQITSAEQLDEFVDAESSRKLQLAKSLIDSGANLILAGGEIDRDILHELADAGILTVSDLDESELDNAAAATGAIIIDSIIDVEESDLGIAGSVQWERRQATDQVEDVIIIDDCKSPAAVTFAIGGAGDTATEEVIRGLHDALRATSIALEEGQLLAGGGATHARIANAVRKASESEPGRSRLAMDAFARAMETIPATLAENSGKDPLDTVLKMRAVAREDSSNPQGVRADGEVGEVSGVWHPRAVIEDGLESSVETAMSMLRIDQVISARGD
tara:strand:+ start:5285 stop:6886 length:1602 start_codon:yes stop_codon:yes gene_type:complete